MTDDFFWDLWGFSTSCLSVTKGFCAFPLSSPPPGISRLFLISYDSGTLEAFQRADTAQGWLKIPNESGMKRDQSPAWFRLLGKKRVGGKAQRGRNQLFHRVFGPRCPPPNSSTPPPLGYGTLTPPTLHLQRLASHGVTLPRYTPSVASMCVGWTFLSLFFFSFFFPLWYYLRLVQTRYLVFVSCILQRYGTQRSSNFWSLDQEARRLPRLWTPNMIIISS